MIRHLLICILLSTGLLSGLSAQQPETQPPPSQAFGPGLAAAQTSSTDSVLVTIILKHQQDKNLSEIRRRLEAQGFWDLFPPAEARVLSWTIAMGMGHVVQILMPANSVRRLNLALQNGAWGAYETEVYLSYDYLPVWEEYIQRRNEVKEDRD